jgi:hypothetical protein
MSLFGNLLQASWNQRAESKAHKTRLDILDLETHVRDLTEHVEHLSAVVIALAEILRDNNLVRPEVIDSKIREIEGRGTLIRRQAKRCDACGRVSSPDRKDCMFCGKALPSEAPIVDSAIGPVPDPNAFSEKSNLLRPDS